jgi:hypothetical protein
MPYEQYNIGKEGNEPSRMDEALKMEPEEDIDSTIAMPAHKTRRQEEQPEKKANGCWFTSQWKDDMQRVQLYGPGPGFSMGEWNEMVRYLASAPLEDGPGNTMEKARRMPNPDGYTT